MSVSIYCSPTHFKLISGGAKGKGIRIDEFHEVPLPEGAMINGIITNEGEMTAFLGQIYESMRIAGQDTTLVIDNNSIRSKLMEVPPVKEPMMLDFIKKDLGAFADEGSDDIFDYAVLDASGGPNGALIMAVSVSRQLIQTYMDVFGKAGIRLTNMDIGANALIKVSGLMSEIDNNTCILAMIDGKSMTLTLFQEGVYSITNKYRLLNLEGSDDWRNEIGSNISSVVQFHKGQRSENEISTVYFAGVSPEELNTLSSAINYLGIPLYNLNFEGFINLDGNAAVAANDFIPGKFVFNMGALLRR